MNLTPEWVEFFMAFAREHRFIVFTHDLDFGNILAVTHARGPSVIQARVQDPVPATIGDTVAAAIMDCAAHLERGALVTIDPDKLRIRILPIVPGLRT